MPRANRPPIPAVAYPKEFVADLDSLAPVMIANMERDGLPVESGQIDLGRLNPKQDLAYFFFMWVSETNEIIDHLNLTLLDLRALPRNIGILGGSPWTRYELLVRTFFHEFYRFRELLNTMLSSVAKRGIISKEELSIARAAFHGAIEGTIDLRNSIVHSGVRWHGQAHFDLNLVSIFHNRGQSLIDRQNGRKVSISKVLAKACSQSSKTLQAEGRHAALIMKAFLRDTVAAVK